jgi:hypothetical protein
MSSAEFIQHKDVLIAVNQEHSQSSSMPVSRKRDASEYIVKCTAPENPLPLVTPLTRDELLALMDTSEWFAFLPSELL